MFIDESRTASKYTNGVAAGRGTPSEIVIHHWGVDGQTHDGVVSFFERSTTQTSAHFVVSAGRIHCIVSTADVAWHAGDWPVNLRSIGIECRPEATDADYAAVAWLIEFLRGLYGDLPLNPHKKYAQTACPGRYDLARLDREARNTITGQGSGITPINPTPMQEDDEMSAADVKAIRGDLNTVHVAVKNAESRIRGDIATVHNTIIRDVGGQLAGLREVIAQLPGGKNIDLAAVEAASKRGAEAAIAEGVVKVDVTIAGGDK